MIYEVKYIQNTYDKLEDYVKNKIKFKLDYEKDCFIYFYLGEKANKYLTQETNEPNILTASSYIKDLETRFNVNINWIDLSFIFENLVKHSLSFDKDDVKCVLDSYKELYFNSIENWINLQNKAVK
jgi:hypothetical protein